MPPPDPEPEAPKPEPKKPKRGKVLLYQPIPLGRGQGARALSSLGRIDIDPASSSERNTEVKAMRWCPPMEARALEGQVYLGLGDGKREWEDTLLNDALDAVDAGAVTRLVVEWTGHARGREGITRLLTQAKAVVHVVEEERPDLAAYVGEDAGVERFCEAFADTGPVISTVPEPSFEKVPATAHAPGPVDRVEVNAPDDKPSPYLDALAGRIELAVAGAVGGVLEADRRSIILTASFTQDGDDGEEVPV